MIPIYELDTDEGQWRLERDGYVITAGLLFVAVIEQSLGWRITTLGTAALTLIQRGVRKRKLGQKISNSQNDDTGE